MSIIQFENGTKVQFNGTPSQRDIEEVAQSLGIELPVTGFMNKAKNFAMGFAQQGIKGVIGLNRLGNSIKAGIDPWHTTQDYAKSAPSWAKGLYYGTPEAQKLTDKFSATNKYQGYGQIAGAVAPYFATGGVGMATEKFASRLLTQMFLDAGISGIQGMGENLSTKENLSMSALNTGLGMFTTMAVPGGKAWEKLGAMNKFGRMLGPGYLGDVASGQMGLRGEDREGVNSLIPGFGSVMGALLGGTVAVGGRYSKAGRVEATIARREQQFSQLERDNRPFARAMDDARASGFEPLNVLSRTNLVDDSVDTTGTIYTAKGLQKIESVLKPLEPVVYKRLVEDGTVITKKQFAKALQEGLANSGLVLEERTQLLKKINQVIKSFDGDAVKGKLPLAKVQKAKISLGQKLSKQWGDPEKGQVNKALYEIYKEMVEKHTTSMDVKTFNRGLSELYAMRKVLLRLNGKKVEGGRLSKYAHQIVGGYAGATVGGAPGAIFGAGVARYARGKQLKGALGGKLEPKFTGEKFENQMTQSMRGKSNTSQTTKTTKVKSVIEPSVPQKKGLFSKVVKSVKESIKSPSVGLAIKNVSGPADETVRIGLSPVKGAVAGKYDDLVTKADALFAEGKFDEATKTYAQIVQGAQKAVQERFKRTNIKVKFTGVDFGVYEGVPEPTIGFHATVKPEDMDLFHNILSDISQQDFKQHSFVTYKQMRLERDVAYGIIDKAKGISKEPHFIFKPERPLTLADIKKVNQALANAELPAMSIKEGGTRVDILHLTGYDKDYEIFSNKIHDFIKGLDSENIDGTYEYASAEVRFVGDKGSSANTTYERSRRDFYAKNKSFVKPDTIESKVLDAIRYKPSISKKELESIVNSGEVSPTEKAVFRDVLNEIKNGQVKGVEIQQRLRGKLLTLTGKEQSGYTNYGWENALENWDEGKAVVFDSNFEHGKGQNHYTAKGLFGHARWANSTENVPMMKNGERIGTKEGKVSTIGELQSDTFQHSSNIDHIKNFFENNLYQKKKELSAIVKDYDDAKIRAREFNRDLPLNEGEYNRFLKVAEKIEKKAIAEGKNLEHIMVKTWDMYNENKWSIEAYDTVDGGMVYETKIKKNVIDLGNEKLIFPEYVKSTSGYLKSTIDESDTFANRILSRKEDLMDMDTSWKNQVKKNKQLYTQLFNEYRQSKAEYEKALAGGKNALQEQFLNFARSNQYRQRLFEETVEYIMKTEKPDVIRVAKPSMVAKIEGYMGSGDDMAPYELPNGRFGQGADDLTYGDEIGVMGEPWTVVDVQVQGRGWGGPPPTEIIVAPADKVNSFRLSDEIDYQVKFHMEEVDSILSGFADDTRVTKEQLLEIKKESYWAESVADSWLETGQYPKKSRFVEDVERAVRERVENTIWDDLSDMHGGDHVFSDGRYDPTVYIVDSDAQTESYSQPSAYSPTDDALMLDEGPQYAKDLPDYAQSVLDNYYELHNKIIPKYEQKIGQKFVDGEVNDPNYNPSGYAEFFPDYSQQPPTKKTF